jgi:transposase
MTRLRGRAPRGERCHASAPAGHWRTTTMLASLRLDGSTTGMAIKGATDSEVFTTCVREFLRPALRAGDIVIMDNLAPHKAAAALECITQGGAVAVFLPAYSPDLNPIEKMWSKLKALLRAAEARTWEDLLPAIAAALAKVTAKGAIGWFASCGYSFI